MKRTWIDELLRKCKEEGINADDKNIEDALNFLFFDTQYTLPVWEWFIYSIKEKERARIFWEGAEKFVDLEVGFEEFAFRIRLYRRKSFLYCLVDLGLELCRSRAS